MYKLAISLIFIIAAGFSPLGCAQERQSTGQSEELPSFSITQWGKESELFLEHKGIVANRETSFAAHLTILENFKAVSEGKVSLIFSGPQGEERFIADAPVAPGIFRPVAKIVTPGTYTYKLIVESSQVKDVFDLGKVEVFKNMNDAQQKISSHEEDEGGVSFLKEQQWKSDFMVEEVKEMELSASLKTYGQVIAPQKSYTAVTAPISGVMESEIKGPSLFRAFIQQGEKLASIKSPSNETVDIVSPASGIASRVLHSDHVESGAKLFEIVDLSIVWVEASVYEPDISKVMNTKEALIEIPGSDGKPMPTKRLIGEGGVFNASSRTLPIIFEVENKDDSLRVGSAVSVYIKTSDRFKGPAVPKSALVEESGRFVVYVQPEGESFKRREVIPSVYDGEWVGIREGLKENERVVTKGSYLVKLASSSSQLPAHGHAH